MEDNESVILLRELICAESEGHEIISRVSILPVGAANAVEIFGKLGTENRLPLRSIAVVDGDEERTAHCLSLPGGRAPERVVFEDLKASNWKELPERFGIGAGSLLGYLEDAILDPDHHKWPERVGDRVAEQSICMGNSLCRVGKVLRKG